MATYGGMINKHCLYIGMVKCIFNFFRCEKRIDGKKHTKELSIRHGSWFTMHKLTIQEILELTYMWVIGCRQVC